MAMTKQQLLFCNGMKMLDRLKEIEATRPLTNEEQSNRDEILQGLFEAVARFGISKARQRLAKYMKSEDAIQDIQQDLAVIFYQKLPNYDPYRSTPTTYFLRYFNQVITEYILKYSQHMSQYDAHNISIVRAAIKYYESRGIKWDEPMIATVTGLSPKVVKNTLHFAANSIRANIDDALDVASNLPTPEDAYIKNERTLTLERVLSEALTPEQLTFFLYKVNPYGKERTYQQVADDLGMQVRDVKKQYSNIIAILNTNRELRAYKPRTRKSTEAKVHLQKCTVAESESRMFAALSNVPLHREDEGDQASGREAKSSAV